MTEEPNPRKQAISSATISIFGQEQKEETQQRLRLQRLVMKSAHVVSKADACRNFLGHRTDHLISCTYDIYISKSHGIRSTQYVVTQ